MAATFDTTEQRILKIIDDNRETIVEFARDIYDHAELGYKEFRTSKKFVDFMKSLQLPVQTDLAITGAKAYLNKEKAGNASLALIGELDALRIPQHAHANQETQAAHCCGHHAQLAGVIGAALALTDAEVAQKLDGQVIFFATPAEEYGEIEFKNQLIADGKIAYGGGKCELIRIGAFDDVDVALAHHISLEGIRLGSNSGNGFVSKVIRIKGKAAHAAGCPEKGVNALSAASLGLQALALNRETFRDEDCVRVHPILTKGGDLVNVVPNEAVLETLVRGKTLEAFADASVKTDRSFKAGALAVGAGYRIETMPGYLPSLWQPAPEEMADAVKALAGEKTVYEVRPEEHSGGSTDVGDVQHLIPVITFNTGGAVGGLHQVDFDIVDEEEAYVLTAKIFALSAYRMLKDGAEVTKRTKQEYHPRFADKQEYIAFMDSFNKVEEAKADYKIEGTVPRELLVSEVRKAARQFAMQFFHFSKVLYDQFGLEKTKDIVRQTVFELAVDRSDQLREKALAQGLKADSVEDFMSVIDLPFTGWIPEWGEDHCPYAEVWRTYFDKYPWFREIAPFYCDVIDTTTIENFSKCLSHRITQNVILEGTCCKREYFESDKVKRGEYTYGKKEEN